MAMNRASFAKMLEPGLNTLFGLEYDQYPAEYEKVFSSTLRKRRLRKTFSYLALEMRQLKLKAGLYLMMLLVNSGQRVTSMKRLLWPSQLLRKLKRMASTAQSLRVTPKLWPVRCLLQKKSRQQMS
jgi:hypothetical protein